MAIQKIVVVIPNWNGADVVGKAIDSLLKQSMQCAVMVVENGSTDKSEEVLEKYGTKIKVLKQPKNLGFAGGVNVGIKYAINNGFEYVALFNNDAVADKDWLKNLVSKLESENDCQIATPTIMKDDQNTLDAIGTSYSIFGAPFPRFRNQNLSDIPKNSEYVFGGAGGASLYKTSLFKDIGYFDEDFFAYYEEDDLNFRAQLAGFKAITVPNSIVYHAIGTTSGKIKGFTTYQTAKNFWFLYTKNMPGYLYFKYLPLSLFWYLLMFIDRTKKGHIKYFLKGYFEFLGKFISTLSKRRYIQKHRKVSIKYIDGLLYHGIPPKSLRKKHNA